MAKGPGGFGDMGAMVRQAQKMQKDMEKVKADLAERVVEGTAGGDMIKVHVNGAQEIVSVKINPDAVDPEDVEMLEDLVAAAVSAGLKKSKEMADKEMNKVTGGLGFPGM